MGVSGYLGMVGGHDFMVAQFGLLGLVAFVSNRKLDFPEHVKTGHGPRRTSERLQVY